MLVLSRTTNEKILISGGIVITILETTNGKVRVGIDAPRELKILRAELLPSDPEAECASIK